jgi:hypothetical protein
MKMLKRFIFLIVLVGLYFVSPVSPAYACSGYPYFGVESLPDADLLVRATVIDADDRGHNAILRVEEYYKGGGTRFITVMRYPPALATGALVRGYDTGCLYAGRGHYWKKGNQGYFGLIPNGDGTFTDNIHGTAHFYPVDGKIYYQEGATEGYAVEMNDDLEISEADFIEKMLDAGERKASVPPKTESPIFYPLMRFLNVTTEKGTRYQINPDRSVKKMEANGPIAISPDGAHLAFRADDETLAFQYIWTEYQYNKEYLEQTPESIKKLMVKGQAANFSSDNNLVAVWDKAHLAIYMISNNSDVAYYNMMSLREIAVHQFAQGLTLPKVIWSANGSSLAWQETGGIWRWNIFDEAKPQQLVKGANLPELMDISTYGRYVRVGSVDKWRLIDTRTGKEYSNTISAPNELYLIAVNTQSLEQTESAEPEQTCKPPLRENCQKFMGISKAGLRGTFLYQMELLGTVSCKLDNETCVLEGRSWHPAIRRTGYSGGRNFYIFITDFRAITYDVQYQQPAILVGDYDIHFDLYSDDEVAAYRSYLDIVNLKAKVDSPIVAIEWGQPVFYDSYLLSSIEYQP